LGVEIHLTRMIAPGVEYLAGTTFTNPSGNYYFTGLFSGFYRIEELPGELVQTYPANGMPHFIDLKEGEILTGMDFGNQILIPGEIRGVKFNDSNSNGMMDGGEMGVSGISICLSPSWRCNTTDSSGYYNFSNLSPGNYIVYEYLSSEYVATTPTMVEIILNSSDVRVVNFGSRLPVPPPSDVSVVQQSGYQNGVPTVFRPALTVLTVSKNLTNIIQNAISVNLTMNWSDGTSRTKSMVNKTNVWTADFSAPFSGGTAQMRFEVDVAPAGKGSEDAIQIGDIIFIDPSGMIKNACTGDSISDATVTLLVEYPPGTNNFIVSPPEKQIPGDNPVTSDEEGRYSWLTIPGTYKVRAEKTGYITTESVPVAVPPPATDVNLSLTSIGGCVLPSVRYINGSVRDSITKTPLSGVIISTTDISTTSNETGFYSLAVADDVYDLTSTFDIRYYSNSTTASTIGTAVVVKDIELLKKPTGNITGSVTRFS